MMFGINRLPVYSAADSTPGFLGALLVPVVASLAQRLPVRRLPEQPHVTAMRRDVIDYRGRYCAANLRTHRTERTVAQVALSGALPG